MFVGLRQSGDKLEMIARLLLHIIDPTINYSQMTGREVNLKYVDETDLADGKIKVIPIGERETDPGAGNGPDAEDLMVLKRKIVLSSPKNAVGGRASRGRGSKVITEGEDLYRIEGDTDEIPQMRNVDKQKTVMDGLTRRELEFEPIRVKRTIVESEEDKGASIRAYIVGGRNVLKSWERNSAVVVLLPDEKGWRDKDVRVFADEISFFNQAIVVVPDLYRGKPWSKKREDKFEIIDHGNAGDDNDTSTQLSAEYISWLNSHSEKRIFDDIACCLRFSQQQYDSKALSLAGIGCGGGWALKAACDLSDIQSAAALAFSIDTNSFISDKDDRSVSMNPFPGSTRGYPRSEEVEKQLLGEGSRKMSKSVEDDKDESGDDIEGLDGLDVQLEEGDTTDLKELMKIAGLAEEDEREKEEEPDDYDLMERYRDELDADVNFRAMEIVAQRAHRGKTSVAHQSSISLRDTARLEPCGVLAICPSLSEKDLDHVGKSLRVPSFLIFGELDKCPGAGLDSAEELHALLSDRLSEVADLSIRVYQGRNSDFAHAPKTDEDRKCSQEATAIGSIWLDVFSAGPLERTNGQGMTRLADSFCFISNKDIARQSLQPSSIASQLHDDASLFRNDRLADDI
jgi:hypothetical protein